MLTLAAFVVVFGMIVLFHELGHLSWPDWREFGSLSLPWALDREWFKCTEVKLRIRCV